MRILVFTLILIASLSSCLYDTTCSTSDYVGTYRGKIDCNKSSTTTITISQSGERLLMNFEGGMYDINVVGNDCDFFFTDTINNNSISGTLCPPELELSVLADVLGVSVICKFNGNKTQ